MPLFQVAIYHPDDYNPSQETPAMIEGIHALNHEMIAAGARKFACGITPAAKAKTLRWQADGNVRVTDGPYTETKEHIGGFWILETADETEAVEWARKGAVACRASAEVRQIFFQPDAGEQQSEDPAMGLGSLGKSKPGEKHKPLFLSTIILPDDFDPSSITEAMMEEMGALGREMAAADASKFACGLAPASIAKTLRRQPDGKVLVTDGPYTETKEHIGGISIVQAVDLDEAVEWARKGAAACRASGEVRELLFFPAP
ncbi:MAG TPA: YciI family protein [Terracidiphilus sp.]|nr:YciI family protein [Terracidiphilus sp.]